MNKGMCVLLLDVFNWMLIYWMFFSSTEEINRLISKRMPNIHY